MDGPVGPLTFCVAVEGTAAALEVWHLGARPTAKAKLRLIHIRGSRLRSLRSFKIHSHKIDIAVAIHAVVVVHLIIVVLVIIGIVARLLLAIAASFVHLLVIHAGRISLLLIVVVIVVGITSAAATTNVGFFLHKPFGFYGRIDGLEDR